MIPPPTSVLLYLSILESTNPLSELPFHSEATTKTINKTLTS